MVKDEIRRGYTFKPEDGGFYEALDEGHGVVVFPMGTLGYRAYDCPDDWRTEAGQRSLRQNLAGADITFEGRAWLVTKEKGKLVWRTKDDLARIPRGKAAAILTKRGKQLNLAGACQEVYG